MSKECSILRQRVNSALVSCFMLIVGGFGTHARGQSCPSAPTTYQYGTLVVKEGQVIGGAGEFSRGADATVAVDSTGRFMVAWMSGSDDPDDGPYFNYIMVTGFDGDAACIRGPVAISGHHESALTAQHYLPSAALSIDGMARVGWIGWQFLAQQQQGTCPNLFLFAPSAVTADFDLGASTSTWPVVQVPTGGPGDPRRDEYEPSVGVSEDADVKSISYTKGLCANSDGGLKYLIAPSGSTTELRDCSSDTCQTRVIQWTPCLSTRSDDYTIECWAEAESTTELDPPFNVKIQLLDGAGGNVGTEIFVNQTSLEFSLSKQDTPAVAFDDVGNIVVVWRGLSQARCSYYSDVIYARRFALVFSPSIHIEPVADQIVVNSNPAWRPDTSGNITLSTGPNPTVALSQEGNGRFIVAWNAKPDPSGLGGVVRAQYFDGGVALGKEFTINQDVSQPGPYFVKRRLSNSAQHAIAYGPSGEVICAWSFAFDDNDYALDSDDEKVYFTILPPGFADYLDDLPLCCRGDANGDTTLSTADIPAFVAILLGQNPATQHCLSPTTLEELLCIADLNNDGKIDGLDIQPFIELLLSGATCEDEVPRPSADCNGNEQSDVDDIAKGISQDCNQNLVPDECDIASETSADVNSNDIPDECEADCNRNGVPDGWDISQSTSNDVNSNGVPDECEHDCNTNGIPDSWDISQQTSADCNQNGEPDECEPDCNANGVPDDCDVDPNDPDGNQQVSLDCNGNGLPDECDLSYGPPFGSLDCNGNGVPDECDIAACENDPACGDCNENGLLDLCDIETGISEDANENDIPDECEGQQMMGGQSSPESSQAEALTGGTPVPPEMSMSPGEESAWAEFYEWCDQQCWGPECETSGAEQFEAYIDKLMELGLPVGG